jgi:hypothetical protein
MKGLNFKKSLVRACAWRRCLRSRLTLARRISSSTARARRTQPPQRRTRRRRQPQPQQRLPPRLPRPHPRSRPPDRSPPLRASRASRARTRAASHLVHRSKRPHRRLRLTSPSSQAEAPPRPVITPQALRRSSSSVLSRPLTCSAVAWTLMRRRRAQARSTGCGTRGREIRSLSSVSPRGSNVAAASWSMRRWTLRNCRHSWVSVIVQMSFGGTYSCHVCRNAPERTDDTLCQETASVQSAIRL